MATANIEIMSKKEFTVMILIAVILQVVGFIIIPASYSIHDDSYTTKLKGFPIDQFLKNNCTETAWRTLTGESIYRNRQPHDNFMFQLPRLNFGDLRYDNTKWRSKLAGYLSIHMREMAVSSNFHVHLMTHQVNCAKWSASDNSTLKIKGHNSSHPRNSKFLHHASNIIYNYTMPLFDFEPSSKNYTIAVFLNPPPNTYGPVVYKMTLRLVMRSSAFIEFMAYRKIIFFLWIVILTICFAIQMYKHSDNHSPRNAAVLRLAVGMIAMDLPTEWMVSHANITLLLLKNLVADLHYFSLMSFCIIFVFDCIAKQDPSGSKKCGARYITSIVLICVGFITNSIFHSYQTYMEVLYPLSSLDFGNTSTLSFIVAMTVIGAVYLINLIILIPEAVSARFCQYDRTAFTLLITVICISITIVESIYYDMTNVRYQMTKWAGVTILPYPAKVSIAVFGMWNIYTLLMLILYFPVHKDTFSLSESTSLPPSYDDVKLMESTHANIKLTKTGLNDKENIYIIKY